MELPYSKARDSHSARGSQLITDNVTAFGKSLSRLMCTSEAQSDTVPLYGNRLDSEAFQIALGLRLGLPVAAPTGCVYVAELDELGAHAQVCKRSTGKQSRSGSDLKPEHQSGLHGLRKRHDPGTSKCPHTDARSPDGITVLPFESEKPRASTQRPIPEPLALARSGPRSTSRASALALNSVLPLFRSSSTLSAGSAPRSTASTFSGNSPREANGTHTKLPARGSKQECPALFILQTRCASSRPTVEQLLRNILHSTSPHSSLPSLFHGR